MKLKLIRVLFVAFLIWPGCILAKDYSYCKPSAVVMNDYEPEHFITSNNLLAAPGRDEVFCGERIVLYGRVTDEECNPIVDAKVYLWQVDCQGKYPYKPLRNKIDLEMIDQAPHQSFTGNGVATTNNQGEFVFVTTYPQSVHGMKPHVNLRVEHYRLGSLQTKITLSKNKIRRPELIILDQAVREYVVENKTRTYGSIITLPSIPVKQDDNALLNEEAEGN